MKLLSTYRQSSLGNMKQSEGGFTLIEVLLVLALLVALSGVGLFYSVDSFRRSQFRAERDLAVSVLEQARAQSMANVDERPHGVHINTSSYILFSGSTFDAANPNNRSYPVNAVINHTGMTDVVFEQVSGNATVTGGSLIFSHGVTQSVITISNVGQINWTQ